ncbi:MAG: hypothetical protein OHK0022_13780 [Roseiflexaceae bacterium]
MEDYGTIAYARRGGPVEQLVLQAGTTMLGRASTNDVVLDDDGVAPRHAALECDAEGCWIRDLESERGVFLNQVRLARGARRLLRNGDVLRIGPFFLSYTRQHEGAAQPLRTAPATNGGSATPGNGQKAGPPPALAGKGPIRRLPGNGGPPDRRPPNPIEHGSRYMQYLPPPYQNSLFLERFLMIFESILTPIEQQIDQINLYFDPQITPEELLPWLSTWFALVLNDNWPVAHRRELIRSASELYRWRGTKQGLRRYLEICTGITPRITEPQDTISEAQPLPAYVFRVSMIVDNPETFDRRMVELIIESQKPAHTSYILELLQSETPAPVVPSGVGLGTRD